MRQPTQSSGSPRQRSPGLIRNLPRHLDSVVASQPCPNASHRDVGCDHLFFPSVWQNEARRFCISGARANENNCRATWIGKIPNDGMAQRRETNGPQLLEKPWPDIQLIDGRRQEEAHKFSLAVFGIAGSILMLVAGNVTTILLARTKDRAENSPYASPWGHPGGELLAGF